MIRVRCVPPMLCSATVARHSCVASSTITRHVITRPPATKDFIRERDASRLATFSARELADYFLSHDEPHLTSKVSDLLKEPNNTLRANALEAVEIIGAQS